MAAVREDAAANEEQETSVASLLRGLIEDGGRLVRNEFRLIRAEFRESLDRLEAGVAMLLAGMAVAVVAGVVLAGALVSYLSGFLPAELAGAIVGGGLLAIAALLVAIGRRTLRSGHPGGERP